MIEQIPNTKKTLLGLIDVQPDFITGALPNPEAQKAMDKVRAVVKYHKGPLAATQDTHFKEQTVRDGAILPKYENSLEGKMLPVVHCIEGTEGWEIEASVKALIEQNPQHIYIKKYTFGYTGWKQIAEQYDTIVLIGFCTDICVISNALNLRALFPNKRIVILEDACAGVTVESHKAALLTAKMCQIEVATVKDYIGEVA